MAGRTQWPSSSSYITLMPPLSVALPRGPRRWAYGPRPHLRPELEFHWLIPFSNCPSGNTWLLQLGPTVMPPVDVSENNRVGGTRPASRHSWHVCGVLLHQLSQQRPSQALSQKSLPSHKGWVWMRSGPAGSQVQMDDLTPSRQASTV